MVDQLVKGEVDAEVEVVLDELLLPPAHAARKKGRNKIIKPFRKNPFKNLDRLLFILVSFLRKIT